MLLGQGTLVQVQKECIFALTFDGQFYIIVLVFYDIVVIKDLLFSFKKWNLWEYESVLAILRALGEEAFLLESVFLNFEKLDQRGLIYVSGEDGGGVVWNVDACRVFGTKGVEELEAEESHELVGVLLNLLLQLGEAVMELLLQSV